MKVLLLTFVFFFLAGCDRSQPAVKIGVVLPLSGVFEIYGSQGLNGARLAVAEINAAGGVLNGRPLELIEQDNRTQPAEAVRIARELIQIDNVFALMGPVSSNARNAMLEVADKFRVPMLYGIDYEGMEYSRYLFQYSSIPDHYINPVVPYLMQNSGSGFYVFGYDYVWPHRIAAAINSSVSEHDGKLLGTEFTPFGVEDYTVVLQRINASGADNLMLVLPGSDGFRFLRQFSEFEFDRPIKVFAFAADETYLKAVAPEHMEGILSALHFFSSYTSPTVEDYVSKYNQMVGKGYRPTYSSKAHYDLIYLLAQAIDTVGKLDREEVIDAMVGLQLYAGEEQVTVRNDHHFDLPMYLAEFSQGQLNVIREFGIISPSDQRQGNAH